MRKEERPAYAAVPTSDDGANGISSNKIGTFHRRHYFLYATGSILLAFAVVALFVHTNHYLDDSLDNYDNLNPLSDKDSPRDSPLIPNDGRDWLVLVEEGTICAKHNPSLCLGRDEDSYPLVLVPQDSNSALPFPRPWPFHQEYFLTLNHKWAVVVQERKSYGPNHVHPTRVAKQSASLNLVQVSYPRRNCQVTLVQGHYKLVLQVTNGGNIVPHASVNFVENRGGGARRDFVWTDSGRIATRRDPNLVLGRGAPNMVLVDKESPHVLNFQHAEELANGKTVPMTTHQGYVVTKRYNETRLYNGAPWRYVESQVELEGGEAIQIRQEGNYIVLNDEKLMLQVSFGDVKAGATVNFVGGDNDMEQVQSIASASIANESSDSISGIDSESGMASSNITSESSDISRSSNDNNGSMSVSSETASADTSGDNENGSASVSGKSSSSDTSSSSPSGSVSASSETASADASSGNENGSVDVSNERHRLILVAATKVGLQV